MTAPPDEPRAGHPFPKSSRLLRRAEFLTVQSKGARVHTTHFTLALRDRGDGEAAPRLGVTASRKAANSVGRNRVRRLVREVFRLHPGAFPAGHDCVVIVHEKVPELDLATVRDELLGALARRRSGAGGNRGPAGRGGGSEGVSGARGGSGSGGGKGSPDGRAGGQGRHGPAGSPPRPDKAEARPTGQTRPADTKNPHAARDQARGRPASVKAGDNALQTTVSAEPTPRAPGGTRGGASDPI